MGVFITKHLEMIYRALLWVSSRELLILILLAINFELSKNSVFNLGF
jgi:hypothetical protein